jgi:hypothetical protein
MAKQTFTTGQVLTAAQMTSLQQTAMGGGAATAKTASYTLVAADAGTTVIMNSGSATTITVDTSLFAAGDTVFIVNQGAGACTITAGTATVTTAGSLTMSQNETGQLYFLSSSAAIFTEYIQAAGVSKIVQVISASTTTSTAIASTSYTDSGLSATITPTSATSKILVLTSQVVQFDRSSNQSNHGIRLLRGATSIGEFGDAGALYSLGMIVGGSTSVNMRTILSINYMDSPSTTSATTYKIQGACNTTANGDTLTFQNQNLIGNMILMEVGA